MRIRVVLSFLILFCTVTAIIPYFLIAYEAGEITTVPRNIGIFPIIAGVLLYSWCCRSFWVQGKGTAIPLDPPRILVVHGPYRIVRNPMFIAAFLVLMGEVVVFRSASLLLYTGFFCAMAQLLVCFYEEPTLLRKFGRGYSIYCASVGRWFPQRKEKPMRRTDPDF